MGRYDFLDEELKNKLEEKQKELITDRKKEEVKKSKKKGKEEDEEKGPSVYTKEDGSIGGVIYPEGEDKPRKESKSAAEEILGSEESNSENNPGKEEEEDLPVKLHHTRETKVGSKDRPKPKKTENPGKLPKKDQSKKGKNNDDVEGARESIWQ